MRGKRRCYLCGGKLTDGWCKACGLDTTRLTGRTYRLNESSLDRKKPNRSTSHKMQNVTRIETFSERQEQKSEQKIKFEQERKAERSRNSETKRAAERKNSAERKNPADRKNPAEKSLSGNYAGKAIGLLCVVIIAMIYQGYQTLKEQIQSNSWGSVESGSIYDNIDETEIPKIQEGIYNMVRRESPAAGEHFEAELTQGSYQVGVQIPEGTYQVDLVESSGQISLNDEENVIYIYCPVGTEPEYGEREHYSDLRLYSGADLQVIGDVKVRLSSDNAQIEGDYGLRSMKNPLTESVLIRQDETLTAGEDFPAGVYDFQSQSENCWAEVTTMEQNGYDSGTAASVQRIYLWNNPNEQYYHNVILQEGTEVAVTEGELLMVPSEVIEAAE